MTALHLLEGLREDGVTFALEGAEVLVLTLPSAVVLRGVPVPGRPWSTGLVAAVQQFDHYLALLTGCGMMPEIDADELSWRLLLAGYAGPGA